jgi:sugar lactone lactonase YvrE
MRLGPLGFTTHVDGLSLARDGATLYFSAVTSQVMYAVPVLLLLEATRKMDKGEAAPDKAAAAGIFVASDRKPVSDGQSSDAQGNVWITAFSESSLAVLSSSEHRLVKVVESSLLRWPDGLSFGPDGLYLTESALSIKLFGQKPAKGKTFLETHGPFYIYRIGTASLQQAFGDGYELPAAGQ